MERRRQVDRENDVPFVHRKFVDGSDELNAGVVDQDIDRSELGERLGHHRLDPVLGREIGAVEANLHAAVGRDRPPDRFDLLGVPEAIKYDIRALCRKHLGDAEPDTAGRSCDQGGLSLEHVRSP